MCGALIRGAAALLVVWAALIAPASPAFAQDGSEASGQRTLENAQKFLTELPSHYKVLVSSKGSSLPNHIGYKVVSIQHDGQCSSTVEGLPSYYMLKDPAGKLLLQALGEATNAGLCIPFEALIKSHAIKEAPFVIDWATVDPVDIERGKEDGKEYRRNLTLTSKDLRLTFVFPSEVMAGRAILAMEVIRAGCDPMKATGF